MPPSVKVYTRIRALTGELLRHRVFSDKIHDVRASLSESWRQGVLYLFDMGFSSVFLWKRICEDGAYFLTRLNDNFEPVVVATNRRYRHHPSPEGIRLRMMCRRLKKTTIDAQCRFDLREPGGREPIDSVEFRVIALWNFKQRKHHFYVTNVPPGVLRAELIADAYRLRWEVETFYKVGKSGLGLEDIRANRPQVINSLIRAALIRASISMQAMLKAEEAVPKRRWLNPHAWAIVWRDVVEKLVPGLRSHGRSASKQHVGWRWIAALAVDPNRKRPPTRVRIRRMRAVPSG